MYLKKLEIVGFKSFADRTKIEFHQGITAIVGPNGSGKSNITEALRWVLGEQSAKSLRGGKMPDVIFAGTEKRQALNYAEVTAKFDNSDGELAGDFGKELIVSRRLYRNGDSDFLINGKKKRLKDIHHLFLDIGLGRDSLSIISQGRIETVFSAKAEERRAIIEEAAGVAKFKFQKHETELKLSNVQDNLNRLEDIIYELSGQLIPLKAQKETALKFQEIDAEREKLALSLLISKIQQEKIKYEASKEQLSHIDEKLKDFSGNKNKFETESISLKKRREEVEKGQEDTQNQVLQLTTLKGELEKKLELFELAQSNQEKAALARNERKEELETRKIETQDLLEKNLEQKEKLEVLKSGHQENINQLNQELEGLSESPEKQMDRLRETYLALVSQEAELSNQLTKNKADTENIERQQSNSIKANREAAGKLSEIEGRLSEGQAALEAVRTEIDETLQSFLEEEAKNKKSKLDLEKAESAQFKSLEGLNQLKARLSSLENIRDNHSNLYAGVRAVMQARLSGVIGIVADLINFDKRYELALEVALGAATQNIVTDNEQSARSAIRYLQEKKLGRATFLPLTTIRERDFRDYAHVSKMKGFIELASNLVSFDEKLRPAISNLLGRTVIVDTVENAGQMARDLNYSTRIVSLDGTQINPGGSYAGGSRNSRSSTFVSNEIEELKKGLQKAEAELLEKEAFVRDYRRLQKELEERLLALRQLGETKRLSEKEAELKVQQLRQRKSELEELLSISESEHEVGQLSALRQKNQEIRIRLSTLSDEKEKINQALDIVREDSSVQEGLKANRQSALTAEKIELSKVVSELKFLDSEEKRLLKELSDLDLEIKNLEKADEISIDSRTLKNSQERLQETNEKLKALAINQVSLRFSKEDLSAQIEEIEKQTADLAQQDQEYYEKKTRLEIAIEQSERTLFSAQNTLSESYQMSYESAKAKIDLILEKDLGKSEKQVRDYERQIRALGPINLESILQYDEINSRYEFLDGQRLDLLESKNLLLSTINEMDEEVRSRFKATFEAVRDSFKVTFGQMFGGGEADLILTTDNLLEAGIDIVAQPPGKRLGNLSLMSGGEKALTALALLFAILRVRKMPFVILDEVEAALDEANVKRFGDYMNHFDSSNQFIVVTHRKGTMAAAKVMYGVTMGNSGVSKIVSVRFEDKNDKEKTA